MRRSSKRPGSAASTASSRPPAATPLAAATPSEPAPSLLAVLTTTSTSSASLRAVEVARPIEELETSDAFDRAPPEVSMVALTAVRGRAPKPGGGNLVRRLVLPTLGAGLVLGAALALGSRPPGGAPAELAAASPPPVEPASAPVAAAAEIAPTPAESEPVPVASAEAAPPALPQSAPSSLPAHDQEALKGVLHWGFSRAEACHREGRPSGTVRAIVTFGPEGKVRLAELEGEPIASAAVGKCILSLLRSMMIPAFSGPEFSITREITLR